MNIEKMKDELDSIKGIFGAEVFGGDEERAEIRRQAEARRELILFKKRFVKRIDEVINGMEAFRR